MIPAAVAELAGASVAEFQPYLAWLDRQQQEPEDFEYDWGRRLAPAKGEQHESLIGLRHKLGASRDRAAWLQFHSAITGWNPDPWQLEAHLAESFEGPRTNKLLTCGIGVGKTEFGIHESCILHVVNPGADHLVLGPTYDLVRDTLLDRWEELMDLYADAGYPILRRINRSIFRADLLCGGRVFFRSAEKIQNLRGTQFCSIFLDEAEYAREPMNAITTLLGRLRSTNCYVRQILCTTTPRGLAGGILEYWHNMRRAMHQRETQHERELGLSTWYASRVSSFANPRLPPDFFEGFVGYSKRRFEEDVLGYPGASTVLILPEYDPGGLHGIEFKYEKGAPYDMCCDWGQHPYFGWIQPRPKHRDAVVFAEWCEDFIHEDRQLAVLEKMAVELGRPPTRIAVDRNDPQMIAKVQRLFPDARIRSMEGKADQERGYGIEAIRALVDPIIGPPKLKVAKALIEGPERKRGLNEALRGRKWAERHDGMVMPWPADDPVREHAFDAISYWARAFGRADAQAQIVPWAGRSFLDLRMAEAERWAHR